MDLPPINEQRLQQRQQAGLQHIQQLTQVLGIKLGDQFAAQVAQARPISADEQQQLLNEVRQQLQQLGNQAASPAAKALLAQLNQQQQLLQQPQLQLISLRPLPLPTLTGSNASALLAARIPNLDFYTDQPLNSGQRLLIKLDNQQQLQILGALPAQLPLAALQKVSLEKLLGALAPLTAAQPATPTSAPMVALREALAQLLPQQGRPELLGKVEQLVQQLQQLPASERQQVLPSQVQTRLAALAQQLRDANHLTQPQALSQSLRNSGLFWEHKLAQLIAPASAAQTPMTTTATASAPGSPHQTAGQTVGQGQAPTPDNNSLGLRVQALAGQDSKGLLLGLLQDLEQALTGTGKETPLPAPASASPLPIASAPALRLTPMLANIFTLLLGVSIKAEQRPGNLRTQALQQLQQQVHSSLARIQLQQLHNLSQRLEPGDSTVAPSLSMDIPLRQGQEIQQLHIQLLYPWQEQPQEREASEARDKATRKTRQWQVMLNFDLTHLGRFYVQLTLLGESLSANFWAERRDTLDRARTRLGLLQEKLEKEGLQINSLQCLQGLPPQQRMTFSYALVDVTT